MQMGLGLQGDWNIRTLNNQLRVELIDIAEIDDVWSCRRNPNIARDSDDRVALHCAPIREVSYRLAIAFGFDQRRDVQARVVSGGAA